MPELCLENRVWADGGPVTWRELAARGEARLLAGGTRPQRPIAAIVDGPVEALATAAAACRLDLDVAIVGRERLTDAVAKVLADAGLAQVPAEASGPPARPAQPGRVWILTSGTTGTPKLIEHTWETLLTVGAGIPPRRWLLPFQAGSYAWYQLVTPSLRVPGQELVVAPPGDVRDALAAARAHRADAISSTPTFWRVAFMTVPQDELDALDFAQISLGGEIVDQAILTQLARTFPRARLTHIYASTEVGACVVVQDGRAGFPASLLDDPRRRVRLRIAEGRLWVSPPKPPRNVEAAASGWIDTGDLVELISDRVLFRGRAGRQLINVGGNKAYPADVEAALLDHPEVQWCRVEARRAPVVGNLISAKVVVRGRPGAELEQRLAEHCRSRLPPYAVPRFFQFLEAIPVGGNLKSEL